VARRVVGSLVVVVVVFGTKVFLTLQDIHGNVTGQSPQALIAHLKTMYVTSRQKKAEIAKLDATMKAPYTMDEMVEGYFARLPMK